MVLTNIDGSNAVPGLARVLLRPILIVAFAFLLGDLFAVHSVELPVLCGSPTADGALAARPVFALTGDASRFSAVLADVFVLADTDDPGLPLRHYSLYSRLLTLT